MRMDPTDLADVSGYAYTYLLNGNTPAANWTGLFKPGERVRLRLINGSSMSFFDVRIPGLQMTVVATDGQDVEPVTVDELRIGTAEVYDVLVTPGDTAYTLFAQAMDRSGYARGTLAPRAGMTAEVPAVDARAILTMGDMGMHHEGMDHSSMPAVSHAAAESGPLVDMRAAMPNTNLNDPGIGLRDNGRRVLTYADLSTIGGPIDERRAGREIELHLTGHMERYVWSFNGQKFSDAQPLRFQHNERLALVLVNDTMMTHPIHLHGMWSELVDAHGKFQVRKHTVMVQPGQRLAYEVTADALGRWAYHCHLLYHMEAGMFREVVVA
jgi:FtsP/CotA-like multicopper oxidase with cupredoxin domain